MNRRQFLTLAGLTTATLATSPLELLAQDKETITEEEIAKLMTRPTVEDILKENKELIQYVKVNADGTTNYDEIVYQKNEKEKKPVIVFCYLNGNHDDIQKRSAILFTELAEAFKDKITFVAYDMKSDKYKLARREGVTSYPSFVMYSPFDLVKEETATRNDGRIKRIDILRNGPKRDESIKSWYVDLKKTWIMNNLTSPNGTSVRRFENDPKNQDKEILYGQR